MKAIAHSLTGDSDVLHLVELPVPEPGPGEVRVRVVVSGVNPTDWKSRRGSAPGQALAFPEVVPNQDGAGVVEALGEGVDTLRVGQRVWLWEAAWQRANGTAEEEVVLPRGHVVALPDNASMDLGASLGVPAITAHRCLTVAEEFPARLSPGALVGRTILVAGGAGAVGHAAIQLAKWAGAIVIATVSGEAKGDLARLAGADHVVNYNDEDASSSIRTFAPQGVDLVVEVSFGVNQGLDKEVCAPGATVAVYATNGGDEVTLRVRDHMTRNTRLQFVLLYTVPMAAKNEAIAAVTAAVVDGALTIGPHSGLPIIRFDLERTGDAHDRVEGGAVGKVLIDVSDE
ncbi:MAG TPA: NADPH:quinone reductase [Acidimicrobiales bacterium]|nr:NADPH:quinone reductase [Acidimicrobiales bacterium]